MSYSTVLSALVSVAKPKIMKLFQKETNVPTACIAENSVSKMHSETLKMQSFFDQRVPSN